MPGSTAGSDEGPPDYGPGNDGVFAAIMTLSGVMCLIGPEPVVEAMSELGHPGYFAKLVGVAGLLIPGRPKLREWAYAGFTLDLLAAVVSRAATGGTAHVPRPLAVLGLRFRGALFPRRASDPGRGGCDLALPWRGSFASTTKGELT
jgi:hypothetical protein